MMADGVLISGNPSLIRLGGSVAVIFAGFEQLLATGQSSP